MTLQRPLQKCRRYWLVWKCVLSVVCCSPTDIRKDLSEFQCKFSRIISMLILTRYLHNQVKTSFLIALAFFELGSLLCGVAPTSSALIVGRAMAGIGDGAIFAGAYTILATTGDPDQTEKPMKGSTLTSAMQYHFEGDHWASVASVQCLGLPPSWDH